MGLLNKLFGFRWSLYVVTNGHELRYAMHEHSVLIMVGYVMSNYASGGRPIPPWSLHLNFNKTHKSFELLPEHFTPDGRNMTSTLVQKIESIDPDWERVSDGEPVFLEMPSRRKIKISDPMSKIGDIDFVKMEFEKRLAGKPHEETFFDVMRIVFGRSDR